MPPRKPTKAATSPSAVAEQLLSAIAVIRRRSVYIAREDSDEPHLTTAQIELLRLVDRHPKLTVAKAAADLHLAPNTVSTLVGQLSRLGLLDRAYDTTDRRVIHLDVTEASKRRLSGWRRRRLTAVTKAMASLDPADRDRIATALAALDHLGEALEPK
jgi:DNA-binding MarR family transcriptional regulator